MTLNIIRKASQAVLAKRTIDSYDLPEKVKKKIANLHFSQAEINEKYRQSKQLRS